MIIGIILIVSAAGCYISNVLLIKYYLDKNAPGILDVDSALPKPNVGEEYLWEKTAGTGIVPKWVSFIGLLAIPLLIIGIIVLVGVFVL